MHTYIIHSMSSSCFLLQMDKKNTQKKTVIILCGQTGFLEEMDNKLEMGFNLISDRMRFCEDGKIHVLPIIFCLDRFILSRQSGTTAN